MGFNARMKSKWEMFECVFNVFCFMITFGLISFWGYKFFMNEDLSVVEYSEYDNDKDGNPYLPHTLCFRNPFLAPDKTHLNQSQKLNIEKYLSGDESVDLSDLDYKDTALNLSDYVQQYYIRSRNGTHSYFQVSEYKHDTIHDSFNGIWLGKFIRCFTLIAPNNDVAVLAILFNNSVHDQGTRPILWDFFVMFHYPNQILRSSLFNKYFWPSARDVNGSTYEMVFTVENVEIFRRRKDCNPNYQTYDQQVMEYMVDKVGCSPPYYDTKMDKPTCTTSKQLKEFANRIYLSKNHGLDPPCKSLEFMTFKYDEIDYKGTAYDSGGNFWLSLVVPNLIFKVYIGLINLQISIMIFNLMFAS